MALSDIFPMARTIQHNTTQNIQLISVFNSIPKGNAKTNVKEREGDTHKKRSIISEVII